MTVTIVCVAKTFSLVVHNKCYICEFISQINEVK